MAALLLTLVVGLVAVSVMCVAVRCAVRSARREQGRQVMDRVVWPTRGTKDRVPVFKRRGQRSSGQKPDE